MKCVIFKCIHSCVSLCVNIQTFFTFRLDSFSSYTHTHNLVINGIYTSVCGYHYHRITECNRFWCRFFGQHSRAIICFRENKIGLIGWTPIKFNQIILEIIAYYSEWTRIKFSSWRTNWKYLRIYVSRPCAHHQTNTFSLLSFSCCVVWKITRCCYFIVASVNAKQAKSDQESLRFIYFVHCHLEIPICIELCTVFHNISNAKWDLLTKNVYMDSTKLLSFTHTCVQWRTNRRRER